MISRNNIGLSHQLPLARISKLFAAFFALLLAVGCEKNEDPTNNGQNIPDNEESVYNERVIIYSVNGEESRLTLETEVEWDALLDVLCENAQNNGEVAFYNLSQTTYLQSKAKSLSKDSRTISTTSRAEIKAWMKEMEKEGLTVRVTYDDNSGTWNGVAYATAPAATTSGNIIGTWHFSCMVVTRTDLFGNLLGSDLYVPEDNGGSMYYTFNGDGTLVLTVGGMDGSTASESGTWSLSDDGALSSELMPNGLVWDVNWITNGTLVISRTDLGDGEENAFYQLQFDAVADNR